ncbi:MAG: trehalose-phosphatase, partial [Mesorhizobium sp.]
AVNEMDGISIRIKPRGPTAARHALADVGEALAWLGAVSQSNLDGSTGLIHPLNRRSRR